MTSGSQDSLPMYQLTTGAPPAAVSLSPPQAARGASTRADASTAGTDRIQTSSSRFCPPVDHGVVTPLPGSRDSAPVVHHDLCTRPQRRCDRVRQVDDLETALGAGPGWPVEDAAPGPLGG